MEKDQSKGEIQNNTQISDFNEKMRDAAILLS